MAGLSPWPLPVPGHAAACAPASSAATTVAQAHDSFETAHVLGDIIGKSMGYAFTAAWTLLVIAALHREPTGRWFSVLGLSVWLVTFGALLLRRPNSAETVAPVLGAAARG